MSFDETQELEKAIGSVVEVAVGDRFSMQKVEESEQAIRNLLAQRSFAFASVSSTIDAFPEEQAVDVSFVVSPGNQAVFGEVTIQGLENVAERYVRRHLKFQPSEVFDGRKVRATQQALFKMGTFSLVTVLSLIHI